MGQRRPGRVRRALGVLRQRVVSRRPRSRGRRDLAILALLTLGVALGIGSLGAAWLIDKNERDWVQVASVNGHAISREALRGRLAVLEFLGEQRSTYIDQAVPPGLLTQGEAAVLKNRASLDAGLEAARQSLIDDELLRQLATRDGIATPATPDPWVEATSYATGDLAHRVRFVRFGVPLMPTSTTPRSGQWPAAAAENRDAAETRAKAELAAGTKLEDIVAGLEAAGWQTEGSETSVSLEGVPSDSTLELDPFVATAILDARPGDLVGPTVDEYGRVALALMLPPADASLLSRTLPLDAVKAALDNSALQSWADGRALRRAAAQNLISGWQSGVSQAHFRELVVGPAPDVSNGAGPWAELSTLSVERVAAVDARSIPGAPAGLDLSGDGLARTLKSMPSIDRTYLFRGLVEAANTSPAGNPSDISGDIGFNSKDQLLPDVGAAAFAEGVKTGDVLGPIELPSGPALLLVTARYSGPLDQRARVALSQVRQPQNPDLVAFTKQFSPEDAALAADGGWRADAEFGKSEPVRSALFDTQIGVLSDPFVLDGHLALAIVGERRSGPPDARMLARLTLDGFDAWFGAELAGATITRSDNPLPELGATATPSARPYLPTEPPLETPMLPVIPGLPT